MADPNGTNSAQNSAIEAVIGVKGQILAIGSYVDVEIPWNCSLMRWTALGDQTGSAGLDVQVCTEAQYDGGATHPAAGDSITGGNGPAIVAATKGQDSLLTGWTRTLTAGNILRVILNSVATIQQITVSLEVFR